MVYDRCVASLTVAVVPFVNASESKPAVTSHCTT
ncbi:hypothetical protein PF003_g33049 [Phytophthora fragariae]|nr:hypothetical protein PF003_g33049 [Phytophthora fragariae]